MKIVPDKTFNFMYKSTIFTISLIAGFNVLESILKVKYNESYNIDKFVIFLDVLLLILSILAIVYYIRKRTVLKYVEELPFKMAMLTINGFVIGILGLIYFNIKNNNIIVQKSS